MTKPTQGPTPGWAISFVETNMVDEEDFWPDYEVPVKRDDQALSRLALEFLRDNRRGEHTYNQVKDALGCDFKAASRVLRGLVDRGPDVVMYQVRGKDKLGRLKVTKVYNASLIDLLCVPRKRAHTLCAPKLDGKPITQHLC
jgi:hypothetical protein